MVDDLGDDGEFALRWTLVNEDYPANLDESLEGGWFGLRVSFKERPTTSRSKCGIAVGHKHERHGGHIEEEKFQRDRRDRWA